MKHRGWSEYRLEKEAGLSQSAVLHMFKRGNTPTYPVLSAICNAFGITLSQFFAERGEPVALTEEQRELIRLFGKLKEGQKHLVKDTMRQFQH